MSMFSRKIGNFEDRKSQILGRYLSLRQKLQDSEDREEFETPFERIVELDEVLYEYYVVKAYLSFSKIKLNEYDTAVFAKIEKLATQLQHLVPIPEPDDLKSLMIVRRELQENAREGGKIINLHELNPANTSKRFLETIGVYPEEEHKETETQGSPSPKKPEASKLVGLFAKPSWSRDHVGVIIEVGSTTARFEDKVERIRQRFQNDFKLAVNQRAIRYLLLHYGFRETGYNLADLHRLFDQGFLMFEKTRAPFCYHRVQEYVAQTFPNQLLLNDVEFGFRMRKVFQEVYGSHKEPKGNYRGFPQKIPFLYGRMQPSQQTSSQKEIPEGGNGQNGNEVHGNEVHGNEVRGNEENGNEDSEDEDEESEDEDEESEIEEEEEDPEDENYR